MSHLKLEIKEDSDIESDSELNDEWVQSFEKIDDLYKDFYKDDIYYINIKILYINRKNEIEKIKQTPFLMSKPNCICREEILEILKKSALEDNRKYFLLSILKYNILLEPDEIKLYLCDSLYDSIDKNYLNVIKNIDTIYFEKTISMFQDLNDIILIFYEKSNEIKEIDPNKCTRRIYLNSLNSKKRTIKKRYKD